MQNHNRVALILACVAGLSLSAPVLAQSGGHDHAGHAAQAAPAATKAAELPLVDAEVRRVDTAQNKLALRHQHIPNLDMPPMSMVFQVADPALLNGLKAGDKLRVTIDEIDGAYTVLSVQPAQP